MTPTGSLHSEDGDRSGRLAQLLAWTFWLYGLSAVAAYVFMVVSASRSAFAGVYFVALGAPWSLSGALFASLVHGADDRVRVLLAFLSVVGGVAVNAGILYYLAMATRGSRGRPSRRDALILSAGVALLFGVSYGVDLWFGAAASIVVLGVLGGGAMMALWGKRC